jgi:hypothetical protein
MEDGAGKMKSAERQKEKSKSGGGQKHGRKTVFWLGASVFFFLAEVRLADAVSASESRVALLSLLPPRTKTAAPGNEFFIKLAFAY